MALPIAIQVPLHRPVLPTRRNAFVNSWIRLTDRPHSDSGGAWPSVGIGVTSAGPAECPPSAKKSARGCKVSAPAPQYPPGAAADGAPALQTLAENGHE